MKENFEEMLRVLYFGIDEAGNFITERGDCYLADDVIDGLGERGLTELNDALRKIQENCIDLLIRVAANGH